MPLILLACLVAAGAWLVKPGNPLVADWLNIAGIVLFLIGILRWLANLPLLLLACALGAAGAIGEIAGVWNPATARWINISGIALFLAGVLRWLGGGKRSARNWKSDSDMAFPPSAGEGSSPDSGSCGNAGEACDGGGDGGGGD